MSNDKMGGPAFPQQPHTYTTGPKDGMQLIVSKPPHAGMTLWDCYVEKAPIEWIGHDATGRGTQTPKSAAREAAEYADAMLEERKKRMNNE